MDAVAVAATCARLLAHKNFSASLWRQLADRAEAVASSAPATSLSFIFKALSVGAPNFTDATSTLQAVIEWRVGELELFEVALMFEAFQNPSFAHPRLVEAVFDHAEQLLQFRDDFSPEDVAFAFKALVALGAKEGLLALQLSSLLMKSDLRCFDCEELLRLTEAFCVAAPVLDAAHSLTQTSQEEKRPLDQRLLQTAYLPAAYEPAPPAKTVCNSPISYRPPNYIPEAPSSPPVKTETFSLGKAKGEDSLVGDKASCVFGVFIPALLQALIAVTPGRLSARQASQALEELAKASLSPPLQSPTGESPSSDASFHQPACEGRQAAQRRRENISSVVERSLRLPLRSDEKKTKGLHPNALLTDRASARSSLS